MGRALFDFGASTGDLNLIRVQAGAGALTGGYAIAQAKTLAMSRRLFDGHPHLMMPGITIEVRELLSLPRM